MLPEGSAGSSFRNNRAALKPLQWWQAIAVERRRWAVGILLIVSVSIIWVAASFVVQAVESEGLHPFLLSYIANSLFIVYLPLHWVISKTKKSPQERRSTDDVEEDDAEASALQRTTSLPKSDHLGEEHAHHQSQRDRSFWGPFRDKKTLQAAVVVAPLWFLAQFTFNLSLHMTSVTSNTILSSTSSLFTYGMSCAFALERLALRKLVFILLCVAGAGLVGYLTARLFGLTVAKGLFDNALSDYLWARAVLLIGPTVATLGLSLQFPIAAVADVATKSPPWLHNSTWIYMLLGALAILAGFFGINVDSWGWLVPAH
ncbi:hypothetical protein WJX73_000997 [Symbiochloris irregularis]|uniref:EamA domain-containing protein n=1 Tax=Symbiochloris irregularis TaxID=706552 RepID=A0AAW1NRI8_9CHLO